MSDPNETNVSSAEAQGNFVTPPPHQPPELSDAERQQRQEKAQAANSEREQKAKQERDADLDRLAVLQREYLDLKDRVSKGTAAKAAAVDPVAAAHARKGDVVREMDVIKRKYNLS